MVGSDVEQDGNVCLELIHVVQLKTAQLNHIIIMLFTGHLKGKTSTDIAGQSNIQTGILEYLKHQSGGCRLTITTGDTYHLGLGVTCGKFYF